MTGIVVLSVAVLLLIAFVLGIVTGAQIASGRSIRWRAKSRQAVTAEALTGQLEALRAELTARPAAQDTAAIERLTQALIGLSTNPPAAGAAPRHLTGGAPLALDGEKRT